MPCRHCHKGLLCHAPNIMPCYNRLTLTLLKRKSHPFRTTVCSGSLPGCRSCSLFDQRFKHAQCQPRRYQPFLHLQQRGSRQRCRERASHKVMKSGVQTFPRALLINAEASLAPTYYPSTRTCCYNPSLASLLRKQSSPRSQTQFPPLPVAATSMSSSARVPEEGM